MELSVYEYGRSSHPKLVRRYVLINISYLLNKIHIFHIQETVADIQFLSLPKRIYTIKYLFYWKHVIVDKMDAIFENKSDNLQSWKT